jgi:superfamily II DNA or RNA helicase
MKIHIDDKFIILIFDTAAEERIVKDAFSFDDMSAVFIGGSFDKRKIKRKCLMKSKKNLHLLFSGFLQDLLLLVKGKNIKVTEIEDKRSKFPYQLQTTIEKDLLKELFPPHHKYIEHQVESLKRMLQTNVGIIEAPTSSGKSETMIAFIKATKLPTLIVVNRISLAIQLKDRLCEQGIQAQAIYSQTSQKLETSVVVATIGSVKKVSTIANVKVLIVDECHRAGASAFQNFFSTITVPIRFGFSATPNSGDKYKFALIRQFLGNVIYKVDVKELMENEVIAKPKISFVKNNGHNTLSWSTAYNDCIVHNIDRNNKIKELVEKHNLQTLILVRIIEHGEELFKLIPDSVFVSGIDDALYRKEVIRKFEAGEIKTIISSSIFNEGISINAIKLLIIASGGKSKIETIQKLGRGLRIRPDKTDVIVIDFEDSGNLYTERHSVLRRNTYEKAGFSVIE